MPHPAALDAETLYRQCDVERLRRSGPGGQHRNKVETAVRLTHQGTGVRAEAVERRSQEANRRRALFRLRVNLALEVRCEADLADAPSELWRSRSGGGLIRVRPTHDDFPSLLAEALDLVAAADFDVKTAAEWLDCSTTQLVRFLRNERRALSWVNDQRLSQGLTPLR